MNQKHGSENRKEGKNLRDSTTGRIKGIFDSWGERRYMIGEADITKVTVTFVREKNEKNRVIVIAVVIIPWK